MRWIPALAAFAFLAPTAWAAPNQVGGQNGGNGLPGILGPGGPCSDYNQARDIPFIDHLTQPFTHITGVAPFVNGTDDIEFENSGVVMNAIGAPNDFQLTPNGNEATAGTWIMIPGSVANTGFNLRFARPDSCLGTPCFPVKTPVTNMAVYGGHDFCWVVRVAVFIATTDPNPADETPSEAWDSSMVIGMNEVDTNNSIMAPTTGALTRTGSGAGVWDGNGFLWHLSRAGVLTFNYSSGADTTVTSATTIDLLSSINDSIAHNYPFFMDLGVRIHQDAANGVLDTNAIDGRMQAWFRRVHFKSTINQQWFRFGTEVSGVGALTFILDDTAAEFLTWEVIQSTTDAEAAPGTGAEFYLSHVGGFYTREELTDDAWPH